MKSNQVKKQDPSPITDFNGYYEFLNNDHPCWVYFEGLLFPSISTAFQAARTNDQNIRQKIANAESYDELKEIALKLNNPQNWHHRRYRVMEKLVRDKFKRNKDLGIRLMATQSRALINSFKKGGQIEKYWGVVGQSERQRKGNNSLGKILMMIRDQIKNGTDLERWVNDQDIETDQNLFPEVNIVVQKEMKNVDKFFLQKKNKFKFGSVDACSFKLDHPSISKNHSYIYFSTLSEVMIVDLGSSNGTFVHNKGKETRLEPFQPFHLEKGDVLVFGLSTRRYIVEISYQKVETYMKKKQQEMNEELKKIQSLKKMQQEGSSPQKIKRLLNLKEYSCLYVENINRNYPYKDIKTMFSLYGIVKNIRINIDQKSGRFMGSAIVYYDRGTKISKVIQDWRKDHSQLEFRVMAVDEDQAENIVATFRKDQQKQSLKKEQVEDKNQEDNRRKHKKKKKHRRSSSSSSSRSRSRSRQKKKYR